MGLLPSMVAFSQTYTISPTGYTAKPSYQSLSNSWIGYTTGSNSIWIETKAEKSGNSVVFYVRKSSGTFQNSVSYKIRRDVEVSGSTVTSQGTQVGSGSISAGNSSGSCTITPASGSHEYRVILTSGSMTFYSRIVKITVEAASPTKPSSPNPSNGATNVATSGTFSWSSSPNDGGSSISYDLYLDTNSSFTSSDKLYKSGQGKSCSYSNLKPGTKYYWKVIVYNSSGKSIWSDVWSFTTKDAASPTKPSSPNPSNSATNVATSGTFSWSTSPNDGGGSISYDLYLDTNSSFTSSDKLYKSGQGKSCSYSNLKSGTKYYWKVIVYNSSGKSIWSDVWSFTTTGGTPSGDMTAAEAAQYLYDKGVIEDKDVESNILRKQLAKIAFRGLYSTNGRTVPNSVISDNFPTVYSDIAVKTSSNEYYYQAARALLYLEYGDGVAPFDRNRLQFEPSETITRLHTLKVLMETFNIQPGTKGYVGRAAELGIITTNESTFRPDDPCLRGEAFNMLARIMQMVNAGTINDPNPGIADYFEPLNTTLQTISLGLSLPLGNFQHYTKSSFEISGVVTLAFAHTYNSYNTTLPEVFYGAKTVNGITETYQPLGDGWSHNFHTFITVVGSGSSIRAIVHWGGGKIDVYKSNGSQLVPESYGVYDQLYSDGSDYVVKTKRQVEYRFSKQGGSGAAVLYLSSIRDRNGNTLTVNYESGVNGTKRIANVSDGNRKLTFSYRSGTDLVSSVSDPLGRSIKFAYTYNNNTGRYQLSQFTDAKNQSTSYLYGNDTKVSTSKLLTRIQLPKGNYIENEYDANRRLTKTESGINGVPTSKTSVDVNATYSGSVSTQSQVTIDRGSGPSTYNYTYNANNVVTEMTGAKGLSVSSSYNNASHPELPTSMKNNSTDVSSIEYDNMGNMLSMTTKAIDGSGTLTVTMTYNSMNDLTSMTDAKGNKTTYSYDSKGNLTGISAPEGVTSSISVNSKGLPTSITDAMGIVTNLEYNSFGNLTKATLQALNLSSSSEYDAASRLVRLTDALGRSISFVYDNNDNVTSDTDPENRTTSYTYDENDNMTGVTNAKGGVTSMSYDDATDWLTAVSFAGSTKRYSYNDDGTINSFTKPDGTTLNYRYDNLGRVTFDGVNSYNYDDKLRLSSIAGSGKTLSFTYDGFNRIIKTNCDGQSNNYTYDDNGNCTSVNNTTYGYDKLNRLTSVKFSGKTITYTYRKDSQLSGVSYPNGMTTSFDYDAVGRLISKKTTLSNGTVVAGYNYELDKVGNITNQTTQEPYEGISLTNGSVSYSFNSGNRITKAGDISFSFDENGNTINRGGEQYQWDESDRLTRAGSTSLTYDPLGLIASFGDISFTTDPLGIGYVLSDSKSGAEYIYGNGLEARVKNGKVSYYVTDVRGSVVAIVDENGNITHKYQYDEYGKVTQKEEADYNPFQYVGKYGVMALTDHQYYMRARHYDPTIGRFLSEDPIWSTNLYPYADNNPINAIDPEGLKPKYDEALALAKDAYNYKPKCSKVRGWERIKSYKEESGFQASLYKKGSQYVLAFAGTDASSWSDWKNDLQQAAGFESAQYNRAIELGREMMTWYGANVTFVGHSLGGGLASAASRATGSNAITFNAAGLRSSYDLGVSSHIDAYITLGDELDLTQGILLHAEGKTHYVKSTCYWGHHRIGCFPEKLK